MSQIHLNLSLPSLRQVGFYLGRQVKEHHPGILDRLDAKAGKPKGQKVGFGQVSQETDLRHPFRSLVPPELVSELRQIDGGSRAKCGCKRPKRSTYLESPSAPKYKWVNDQPLFSVMTNHVLRVRRRLQVQRVHGTSCQCNAQVESPAREPPRTLRNPP